MTIRELDHLIGRVLAVGPTTARAIHSCRDITSQTAQCTVYDVEAGLRVWVRNGRARKVTADMYELAIGDTGEVSQ